MPILPAMATFRGTMSIAGHRDAVPVEARVESRVLVLEVDGQGVGSWDVSSIEARANSGGVTLALGHERVTIDVTDRTGFLEAIKSAAVQSVHRTRRRLPSLRLVLAVAVLGAIAVLAVRFPESMGSGVVLAGLALLLVGVAARFNTWLALRLPAGLHPVHFVVGGAMLITVGVGLILIG